MKALLLIVIAVGVAGCGGAGGTESRFAVLSAFVQNPSVNSGSVAVETTKASDPSFMQRSWYNLPDAPTLEFEMQFDKGQMYTVTMKHFDQENAAGNVLQTVSRDADFTHTNRLEMAFQFN